MRLVVLFALLGLTGCELVFPLEPGTPVLRASFTRTATQTDHLVFDGDPRIQQGDVLIAMIQAKQTDDIVMEEMSPGWGAIADDEARGCENIFFHVWFLRTVVTAETTFDFTFSASDDMTALVTAYDQASDAQLMDFQLFGNSDEEEAVFDGDTIAPGSIVWIGGGAERPWADTDAPDEGERLGTVEHLAAYQLEVPDGEVPEIVVPILDAFCADVAQIKVEP